MPLLSFFAPFDSQTSQHSYYPSTTLHISKLKTCAWDGRAIASLTRPYFVPPSILLHLSPVFGLERGSSLLARTDSRNQEHHHILSLTAKHDALSKPSRYSVAPRSSAFSEDAVQTRAPPSRLEEPETRKHRELEKVRNFVRDCGSVKALCRLQRSYLMNPCQ